MRSDPLRDAADDRRGAQAGRSWLIRADGTITPGGLRAFEGMCALMLGFDLALALFAGAIMVLQSRAGTLSGRDQAIFVVVVAGLLLCALPIFGLGRLARSMRRRQAESAGDAAD